PPPARAVRRHRRLHGFDGERFRGSAASALLGDVQPDQYRQREQRKQDVRAGEAHGDDVLAGRVPRTTSRVFVWPPRTTTTCTWSPGCFSVIRVESCVGSSTGLPATVLITSSTCRPARCAGPPGTTLEICAPVVPLPGSGEPVWAP